MILPFTVSACVLSAAVLATAAMAEPKRLAIYYGIPSLVNGAAGDVGRAAAAFAEYDLVVFGDGLEFDDVVPARKPPGAGPIEYGRTKAIIAQLAASPRKTAVFGYVDLGSSQQLSIDEIKSRVAKWKALGAAGIFYDEAGADFGVDRARQNAAVEAAHAARLRVVLNAFNPDDVFRTGDDGVRPRLGAGDAYLLESFAVRNGVAEDPFGTSAASEPRERSGDRGAPASEGVGGSGGAKPPGKKWNDRLERARRGAAATGAAIWATTTTEGKFAPELMTHAWRAAVQAGVDAFSWGEPSFGSVDSRLPFRPRPR